MGTVRGALLISLVERYLLLALALGSNIVLARLLTPEQIGIYSVSMAVLGMAQVLRDFGIGSYLVQARTLDDEQTGTAFGLSMLLGTAFFLVVFLSAPWVADYYRDERVAGTLRICAFNFIVLPFSTVPMAVLRRELKFKQTMHASIASGVVTAFLSAGLAFAGLGVNALALGAMLGNVALVVVLAIVAPRSCFPRPRLTHWRAILSFGGQTSMTGVLNSVAVDMNDLVVGKVLGFQPVPLLSRAQGLMNMVNPALTRAIRNLALPAFASAPRAGLALQGPHARPLRLVTLHPCCFPSL
ncbi:oligosaccharide flippase family protein, partial [Nostoc sp. NIES-2111]